MNILHMIDVPWDSGITHYALILAQGQKKKGHSVFVAAKPGEKPWLKARKLGLRAVPLAQAKAITALRGFLKKHRIELMNAHTGSTHSLAVAAALGQSVAVVRTRADARRVQRRPGNGFLYQHTQRVIAAADYIRDAFIKEIRLPAKKVVTVYQGIEADAYPVDPLPKVPVLGIVARLDPVKGHRYLIEALYLLKAVYPDLKLRVMGQEENIKQHELETIAERLRVDGQIKFMGYQSNVAKALPDCSIGVVASTGSEAVSRSALEWMAAGRPVVATRVGCLPELVEDGVTGVLADPKDAPSLAAALAKMLHDPAKTSAMARDARARVLSHFSMSTFVVRTLEVYREALEAL